MNNSNQQQLRIRPVQRPRSWYFVMTIYLILEAMGAFMTAILFIYAAKPVNAISVGGMVFVIAMILPIIGLAQVDGSRIPSGTVEEYIFTSMRKALATAFGWAIALALIFGYVNSL